MNSEDPGDSDFVCGRNATVSLNHLAVKRPQIWRPGGVSEPKRLINVGARLPPSSPHGCLVSNAHRARKHLAAGLIGCRTVALRQSDIQHMLAPTGRVGASRRPCLCRIDRDA